MAHVDFRTPYRVGRYGVDLEGFEAIVRTELDREPGELKLIVVDEIGKMECLSRVFVDAVTRILDSPVPVLAKIAAKGGGFIAAVQARLDVEIMTAMASNRDHMPDELVGRIQSR